MKKVVCIFCCILCILFLSSCSDEEYDSVKATYADYGYHHDTDYRITELEEKIEHLEEVISLLNETQEECLRDWYETKEAEGIALYSLAQHQGIDEDEFFDVYSDYLNDEYGDPTETIDEYQKSFDEIMKNYRLWNK